MKRIYLLALIIFISCSQEATEEKTNHAIPIEFAKAIEIKANKEIKKSGIISKRIQSALSFRIAGYIDEIYVHEGESFKKGQLLAQLNLTEIESHLKQAEINLKKMKRDYERIQNLYKDSVATFQQLEDITSAYELAKTNIKIARYTYNNASIIAPSHGKILKKLAEKNQLIAAGNPVFFYSDNESKTIIKIAVSDKELVLLNTMDKANVSFDFYETQFDALIIELPASANAENGLFEITLEILNPNQNKLITGMLGTVSFKIDQDEKQIAIPINALATADKDIATIYIYNETLNTVSKRNIEISEMNNSYILVKQGLILNEKIVTNGVLQLYDNAKVKVQKSSELFSVNEVDEK